MPPLAVNVHADRSGVLASSEVETGTIRPVIKVKYLRGNVWHHFVYQATGRDVCLRTYCESIKLDMKDAVTALHRSHSEALDIDVRSLDPRLISPIVPDFFVEYQRNGVTHWFEYVTPEDGKSCLKDYLESIGMSMSMVKYRSLH